MVWSRRGGFGESWLVEARRSGFPLSREWAEGNALRGDWLCEVTGAAVVCWCPGIVVGGGAALWIPAFAGMG